ncbi:hypothetical protein D9611_005842 [Ephemerocybe angulata]|uniref:MYND-type domain-containing protein n=1 Tax=Ephemerocybe angulata TaxID=980116 RepID=A0A8H5CFN8_9AGAR|nr:hypothetical protein D9611_005842 [Tulosesus angulatus]
MAYHPQIYFAIEEVAARIPSQTMASLEEIPVWREFISSGIVYKTAYAEMAHLEDVPLCDNFQHYNTSGTTTNSYRYNLKGAECSWCRTRVYCSIECQTVDWDALHKKECIASRVSRIELELNSAWISHRTRMRFYTLLAKFTLTRYPDDPNESLFVDTRISPPSYRLYPAPVFRDMKYGGRRLFDDERSKAFLEDSLAKKNELFAAVERGSIPHFEQLAHGWPTDFPSIMRAFSAVLQHLSTENFFNMTTSRLNFDEINQTILRSKGSFSVLIGVTGDRSDARLRQEQREELFSVFQKDMSGLLDWFELFARQSPILMRSSPYSADIGVTGVASVLAYLLRLSLNDEGTFPELERITNLLLEMWMAGPRIERGRDRSLRTPVEYTTAVYPMLTAFQVYISEERYLSLLIQIFNTPRKGRWYQRVADSFAFRLQEWTAVHRNHNGDNKSVQVALCLTIIVELYQALNSTSVPCKPFLRPHGPLFDALKRARELPVPIRKSYTLDLIVASTLIPRSGFQAHNVLRALPDILDAGFLDVVTHRILHPRDHYSDPFLEWSASNPLGELTTMLYHPTIYDAVRSALSRLPQPLPTQLTSHGKWVSFMRFGETCTRAYGSASRNKIALCDNLQVSAIMGGSQHHTMGVTHLGDVRSAQCSQCHSVVYCSSQCQQHDWKMIHRDECGARHIDRIYQRADQAWISHRTRGMFLQLLKAFLEVFCVNFQDPGEALFVDITTFPVAFYVPFSVAHLLSNTVRDIQIFEDGRFRAMAEEKEASHDNCPTRLAGFAAIFGQYMISAMGRFNDAGVDSPVEDDGKSLTRFQPLNIYMKLVALPTHRN